MGLFYYLYTMHYLKATALFLALVVSLWILKNHGKYEKKEWYSGFPSPYKVHEEDTSVPQRTLYADTLSLKAITDTIFKLP